MNKRFSSKLTKDKDNKKDSEKDNEKDSEKYSKKELCIRQELILRSFEYQNKDNKTWFLDTETAIYNEFQKKEKIK
jgi:hypothetical protein